LLLLSLLACRATPPDTAEAQAPSLEDLRGSVGHVVVLTLDGARSDETLWDEPSSVSGTTPDEIVPRLRSELFPQGTENRPGYNLGVTATVEAHAALVTGQRLAQATDASAPDAGHLRPEIARRELDLSEDEVAFVANYRHLDALGWGLHPAYGEAWAAPWTDVVDENGDDTEDDAPVVSTLQSTPSAADGAGHTAEPQAYLDALTAADGLVTDF